MSRLFGVSGGGEQYVSVSQTVSTPLTQSRMGGFLSDAAPMADEAGMSIEAFLYVLLVDQQYP